MRDASAVADESLREERRAFGCALQRLRSAVLSGPKRSQAVLIASQYEAAPYTATATQHTAAAAPSYVTRLLDFVSSGQRSEQLFKSRGALVATLCQLTLVSATVSCTMTSDSRLADDG